MSGSRSKKSGGEYDGPKSAKDLSLGTGMAEKAKEETMSAQERMRRQIEKETGIKGNKKYGD